MRPGNSALFSRVGSSLRKLGKVCVCVSGAVIFLLAAIVACSWSYRAPAQFDEEAARGINYSPLQRLVPGGGLPDRVIPQDANNNLDVAFHEGRYFVAFRTGPSHFASREVRMYVLSSEDRISWDYETEFHLGSDLREPRFLVHEKRLLLYFLQNGEAMLKFEPRRTFACEYTGPASWTAPKPVYEPGYVMWRFRSRGGIAYAAVYNGRGLYHAGRQPGEVRLLTSPDGYAWTPVSDAPQVTWTGAEEPEFEFDEEGNLVAVVRLELTGGSLFCTASKEDLSQWHTTYSPWKYDSSLMFRRGSKFFVIARRNVAGVYAHAPSWLGEKGRTAANAVFYSLTRKRTCLYRVDRERAGLVPLFDFPSRGDTAFAGIAPIADDRDAYWVLNYSNPIDGLDLPWLAGQLRPTCLYATTLKFSQEAE